MGLDFSPLSRNSIKFVKREGGGAENLQHFTLVQSGYVMMMELPYFHLSDLASSVKRKKTKKGFKNGCME